MPRRKKDPDVSAKLLCEDAKFPLSPTLSRLFGVPGAVVLQQIHFFIEWKKEEGATADFRDGAWWIYNTIPEWEEIFSIWDQKTLKRVFKLLKEKGVIIARKFEECDQRTIFYTLDYSALNALLQPEKEDKMSRQEGQNVPSMRDKMSRQEGQNVPGSPLYTENPEQRTEITREEVPQKPKRIKKTEATPIHALVSPSSPTPEQAFRVQRERLRPYFCALVRVCQVDDHTMTDAKREDGWQLCEALASSGYTVQDLLDYPKYEAKTWPGKIPDFGRIRNNIKRSVAYNRGQKARASPSPVVLEMNGMTAEQREAQRNKSRQEMQSVRNQAKGDPAHDPIAARNAMRALQEGQGRSPEEQKRILKERGLM